MEKEIKVQKINEQNKLIVKDVPESLLALYLNIGWELYKDIKVKENIKSEPIEEKKIFSK